MFSLRIIYLKIAHRTCKLAAHSKMITANPNVNIILGLGPIISLSGVSAVNESNDKVKVTSNILIDNIEMPKASEVIKDEESGWDRLCCLFKKDEYGNYSKEVIASIQATSMAFFFGLIYGGVNSSRAAFVDFMERNQATLFENHLDAKKRMQNHVTIHFGKGAFKWATKLSLFTGGFMFFVTAAHAYRGQRSVFDYALSASVVGALMRLKLGPPAMVVGGIVGGMLGLLCGLSTKFLLTMTGTSIDEVIAYQYEIDQSRLRAFKEGEAQSNEHILGEEGLSLLKNRPPGKENTI